MEVDERRFVVLADAGRGLGLGFVWGVLARVWMHYLTDNPEFSWTGTAFIVGLSSLTGALLGVVHGARRSGRTRWWRVAAVPTLLLFASPGLVLLPTYILGGAAWAGRGPLWWRGLLWTVVVGWTAFVWWMVVLDETTRVVIPTLGWVLASATMALAGGEIFRRWPARVRSHPVNQPVSG